MLFAFGLCETGLPLAVWFTARSGLALSRPSSLRGLLYLGAFAYGMMVTDWWCNSPQPDLGYPGSSFPGSEWDHYARPAIDLLALLHYVLLLMPLLVFSSGWLTESRTTPLRRRRFTIRGMLLYTSLLAFSMIWIRWLSSEHAPESYFRSLSASAAIREWFLEWAIFTLPQVAGAIVMLMGLSLRWRTAVTLLVLGFLIDAAGVLACVEISKGLGQDLSGCFLNDPLPLSMSYVFGRTLSCWTTFAWARVLGVCPVFGWKWCQDSGAVPE